MINQSYVVFLSQEAADSLDNWFIWFIIHEKQCLTFDHLVNFGHKKLII